MTTRAMSTPTTPLNPESLQSEGIARNSRKLFTVSLAGEEIYDILHLLEHSAVLAEAYLDVRAYVLAAETLRERARGQGF